MKVSKEEKESFREWVAKIEDATGNKKKKMLITKNKIAGGIKEIVHKVTDNELILNNRRR